MTYSVEVDSLLLIGDMFRCHDSCWFSRKIIVSYKCYSFLDMLGIKKKCFIWIQRIIPNQNKEMRLL